GGYPIITSNQGKFSGWSDSAITHSFVFQEPSGGNTWLYYTVNEPGTHTAGVATKSTGGGQVRKVKLIYSGGDWVRSGATSVVWEFKKPIAGTTEDIRVLTLNRMITLSNGNLLLPVAGRRAGMNGSSPYPMNRVWVLESTDVGASWPNSYF